MNNEVVYHEMTHNLEQAIAYLERAERTEQQAERDAYREAAIKHADKAEALSLKILFPPIQS